MTCCPNCGHDLGGDRHRSELERQLGDAARAHSLRRQAIEMKGDWATVLVSGERRFMAWRGYVWAKVRVRKPATCAVSFLEIPAGAWAWRQLSEVKDRDLRVAAEVWAQYER